MTIRRSLNLLEAVSAFTLRVKDSTAERLERRVQRLHALMLQMIEVLNYTSSQGIVMNDVKPQNIFIVDLSNGNAAQMSASTIVTGQARIMLSDYDFVTKRGEPSSGGTVGFTALERFKQKDLPGTPRSTELSDLYSFGASLYALMHGQEAIIEINGGSMSSNPLERKEALGVVFPKLAVYLRKRLAEYRQLVSSLSPETKKQFEEVADFIYGAMHIYDGDRVIYLNRQLSDYIVINEYTRRIESRAGRACEKVYAARPAGFPN
jgi:serine/threonine protein kinase